MLAKLVERDTGGSGLLGKVVRVQRVQNVVLWQRYELCRQGGEEHLGAAGEVQLRL